MKMFRVLRESDGVAIIEFAIVLPLFIVLTFGIIEFGIVMYNQALITNASREGARFGILYTDPPKDMTTLTSEITTRVESYLKQGDSDPPKWRLISLGGPAVPVLNPPPEIVENEPDDYLKVTVKYPYNFLLLPSFIPGIPNELNISSSTSMRLELQQ